jgi:hypothetical protein
MGLILSATLVLPIGMLASSAQPQRVNPFRVAQITRTPSVMRADLNACKELGRARPADPRPLSVADFGKALTGTWVRDLTWYGNPVDSESGLYFDVNPQTGALTGMMYDQSNLERGPMFERREALKKDRALRAKTVTMTFVNCRYNIVDRYYKISEGHEFAFSQRARNIGSMTGQPLKSVFERLRSQNFFTLQDDERSRVAKMSGSQPLNETDTPTVGGGIFEGTVTTRATRWPGLREGLQGIYMRMTGTYEGSHVGLSTADGKTSFTGVESAVFFRDGDAFVASTRATNITGPATGGDLASRIGGWSTDCAGFFNLPDPMIFERVVISTGF